MTASANYDEPWKLALEQYFQPFIAFFFPQAHAEINWQIPYEPLDQEFQQVVREAELGKRFVDKLVKVWLIDGSETWLLIHIEVQSQVDAAFAKRMYSYHYRIFDRYDHQVVSFAILGDERQSWRPHSYSYQRWGCELNLVFPAIKLLDYEVQWQALEQDPNPFAVVVMAHLKTQATASNLQGRLSWKLQLIRGLYERGFSRQDILELFRILDWMMGLPDELQLQFRSEIQQFEQEKQMPYITSVERIGRQEGREEGREEGRQEERRGMLTSLLASRFGSLTDELSTLIPSLLQMSTQTFTQFLPFLVSLPQNEIIERVRHYQTQRQQLEAELTERFGPTDDRIAALVEPLLELPPDTLQQLMMSQSIDELITHLQSRPPEQRTSL